MFLNLPGEQERGKLRVPSEQTPEYLSTSAPYKSGVIEYNVKCKSWCKRIHTDRDRMLLPHSEELRLLSRGAGLALHLQRVDVSDGDDGSSYVPGQTHEGAQRHQDAHPEQVQVVATTFLHTGTMTGSDKPFKSKSFIS